MLNVYGFDQFVMTVVIESSFYFSILYYFVVVVALEINPRLKIC